MVNNDIFTQPVHQYMLLRLPSQMEAWKTWFENILQQIGHFYFCLVHRALLPVIPDPTPAVPIVISNCLKPQKMTEIKARKLFGVILKLCESYKDVVLLV